MPDAVLIDLPAALAERGFALRAARAADEAFARDAHRQVYEAVVVEQFGAWDAERQAGFFAASWSAPGLSVLEREGVRVGYLRVEDLGGELGVRELVLLPATQGAGIGTALLEHLQALAAARGAGLSLEVLHRNRAAGLYARLGFVRVGSTPTHHRMRWSPAARVSR